MSRNYEPGTPITTMEEFDKAIEEGTLLYHALWHRTTNPSVLANMNYVTVKQYIKAGRISIAHKKIPKGE